MTSLYHLFMTSRSSVTDALLVLLSSNLMRSPKLNRVGRLLVGLLAPAIFGSFIIVVYVFVSDAIKEGASIKTLQISLKGFIVFFLVSPFFIGLQSLVYTIVMEFFVRPKVRHRNESLVVSCLLGAASGLVVDMILDDVQFFTIVGGITGLLIGFILYDEDMKSPQNKHIDINMDATHR